MTKLIQSAVACATVLARLTSGQPLSFPGVNSPSSAPAAAPIGAAAPAAASPAAAPASAPAAPAASFPTAQAPTQSVTVGNNVYATLDNAWAAAPADGNSDCSAQYPFIVPDGWKIAPDNKDSLLAIATVCAPCVGVWACLLLLTLPHTSLPWQHPCREFHFLHYEP